MVSVAQPAREIGSVAVANRPSQHVVGEAVDLEEVDARNVEVALRAQPPRPALDGVPVPEVVVVDGEQRRDRRVHDREAEGDDHSDAEAVDGHSRIERRDGPHHGAVQRQHAEPQRQHGERQRHPDQERPDQRVDEADQRGGHERGLEVVDVEIRPAAR